MQGMGCQITCPRLNPCELSYLRSCMREQRVCYIGRRVYQLTRSINRQLLRSSSYTCTGHEAWALSQKHSNQVSALS